MRVAVASCRRLPEPDPDQSLLMQALAGAGVEATILAWDDPDAPFAAFDLVVVRSTWNYFEQVEAFVAWAARVAEQTRLLNPAPVVAWNARKTYLAELEKRGVAVVPTVFVPRGRPPRLEALLEERGWDAVVIKPVVSAGSFRTERFDRATVAAGQAFLAGLAADRGAMVQRWMPSVETHGERSLVWIDGEFTHAIRKSPRFAGGFEQVTEVPVADDERAFATRTLAPLADQLLYARVDLVRDGEDGLCLMELELIEPSLFFRQSPVALARFVAALARRA
jgi:hypothetical protein